MDESKVKLTSRLMQDPEVSIAEVCRALGVSPATLYRYVGPDGTRRTRERRRGEAVRGGGAP